MSTEENKALFRRQIEYWNNKDLDLFWENMIVNYVSDTIFSMSSKR
ncbi:MAG: hypothetical protein ACXADW_14630 [Candidatus Hodarchaeales archaeon]